jgi:hypothetical protein
MPLNGRKRPRLEDIPQDATPRDVLFELRSFVHTFEEWREEVTPSLGFASRLRVLIITSAKLFLVAAPIVTAIAVAFMAR